MKSKNLNLTGSSLSINQIFSLNNEANTKIAVSLAAQKNVEKCYQFLQGVLKKNHKVIYGINTGFGPMANYLLPHNQLEKLQENLILSHAVGMGEKLPDEFVLAAMAVRLNTLVKGHSGVSPKLIKLLSDFINNRIIPVIPEHGAVGTSGDLVQLAHIALALLGKGKVSFQNKIVPAQKALTEAKLKPYKLEPKEGLALINGTSVMTGIAARVNFNAKKLLDLSVLTGCMALEIVRGYDDSFSQKLHSLRPHIGQNSIAKQMRQILQSSHLIRNRLALDAKINHSHDINHINETVQEVYSLRCIAQILGPISDTLQKTWKETEVEMNSVTDNPVIDWQGKQFLHGGNFHGEYIAQGMDRLKLAITKLSMLSERRLNFFVNPNINKNLPPFLNLEKPGLSLALQGLQFVATSTAAHNQTLAYPMSLHSISTNGDNQDVVSMGTDAALITSKVVENAFIVLSIECVALAQAVDYLKIQNHLSAKTKKLYTEVRKVLPVILEDREINEELSKVTTTLKNF